MIEGTRNVIERLRSIQFELSQTQPNTPSDGNCFLHSIIDQIEYDSNLKQLNLNVHSLRSMIVNSLKIIILTRRFSWIDGNGSQEQWIEEMSKDGCFADEVFIRLTSENLNRRIEIFPVFPEDGHKDGKIIIEPKSNSNNDDPLYVLYYSETRFTCGGHYQSIRPQTCENLPKEDQNKTENKQRKISREAAYIDTTNILTNKRKRK